MQVIFLNLFYFKYSGFVDAEFVKTCDELVIGFVCDKLIRGRTMTAMTHKFHPECFVCTYCRKEFKERTFKTDPIENKPYCKSCFEKLLGHFGNAQMYGIVPT